MKYVHPRNKFVECFDESVIFLIHNAHIEYKKNPSKENLNEILKSARLLTDDAIAKIFEEKDWKTIKIFRLFVQHYVNWSHLEDRLQCIAIMEGIGYIRILNKLLYNNSFEPYN